MLWILIIGFVIITYFVGDPRVKKRNFKKNYEQKKERNRLKKR